jgi:hypothetical protein
LYRRSDTAIFFCNNIWQCKNTHSQTKREVLKWATKIAERYMGKKNAEAYSRRNSSEGAVLVRINPTRIIAEKDIAGWD